MLRKRFQNNSRQSQGFNLFAFGSAEEAFGFSFALLHEIAAAHAPDPLYIVSDRQHPTSEIDVRLLQTEAFAHAEAKPHG